MDEKHHRDIIIKVIGIDPNKHCRSLLTIRQCKCDLNSGASGPFV